MCVKVHKLGQNVQSQQGIVGGSFKRYKFRLTTKRRHVTSNARHYTESSQAVLIKALTIYSAGTYPGNKSFEFGHCPNHTRRTSRFEHSQLRELL